MKKLIENAENHVAKVGDVYDLTYTLVSIPFISNQQRKIIAERINLDDRVKVIETDSSGGVLRIRVEVIKNPFPLGIIIALGFTSLVGFFAFSSLSKVEQIFESPTGKISGIAVSIGIIAGALGIFGLTRR